MKPKRKIYSNYQCEFLDSLSSEFECEIIYFSDCNEISGISESLVFYTPYRFENLGIDKSNKVVIDCS